MVFNNFFVWLGALQDWGNMHMSKCPWVHFSVNSLNKHTCNTRRRLDWRIVQIVQMCLCIHGTCGPPRHICSTCGSLHGGHLQLMMDSPWTDDLSGCNCSRNECLWWLSPRCSHETCVQTCRSCSKIQLQ